MRAFLEWTAWRMQPPAPYGLFHIGVAAGGVLLAFVLAWLLRKTSAKTCKWLIFGIGVFLVVIELYKQLFHFYVVQPARYDWWYFPFQLCSIPLYLCMFVSFLRPGAVKTACYHFLGSYTLMSGMIVFVDPPGLLHGYWTLTLHAFVWHILLVFVGAYLAFTGNASTSFKGFRHATYLYLGLCIVALTLNSLLYDRAGGNINMFYLGPMHSLQIVFRDITNWFGWQINAVFYGACTILGAFLAFLPFYKRNVRLSGIAKDTNA